MAEDLVLWVSVDQLDADGQAPQRFLVRRVDVPDVGQLLLAGRVGVDLGEPFGVHEFLERGVLGNARYPRYA